MESDIWNYKPLRRTKRHPNPIVQHAEKTENVSLAASLSQSRQGVKRSSSKQVESASKRLKPDRCENSDQNQLSIDTPVLAKSQDNATLPPIPSQISLDCLDSVSIDEGVEFEMELASAPPKSPPCRLQRSFSVEPNRRQSSLFNFYQPKSGIPKRDRTSKVKPKPSDLSKDEQSPSFSYPHALMKTKSLPANSSARVYKCPLYKRIPGTGMTVDAFSYGSIDGCSSYFLTHFHSDHYTGLGRHFKHPIYCSKITANLVKKRLGVNQQFVVPLPMRTPVTLRGVEVTLLDANHCPGSVMFLFVLPDGQAILHTGDFRASADMETYPELRGICIDVLYLDTTYMNPRYCFPKQCDVIRYVVRIASEAVRKEPKTLIVCGTYSIGKERVFLALAKALGFKIGLAKEKMALLSCLEDPEMNSIASRDFLSCQIHVLPMGHLSLKKLDMHLSEYKSKFNSLLAFKPTGWTYSSRAKNLRDIKPSTKRGVTIYGVPYSEHSSYDELRQFVRFLRPGRIVPTVNVKSTSEMQKTFREWLS